MYRSTNMNRRLFASSVAFGLLLIGLSVVATPAQAHPCFGNTSVTFTCLEQNDETYICAGTWSDDDSDGAYDHKEENTYLCSNAKTSDNK